MENMKIRDVQISRIMDALYARGPQSRIDLSKLLSITPATMSDITQQLINENLIFELGEDAEQSNAGRRKILLGIVEGHSHYVGVELFEHSLSLCLTDNRNRVLDQIIYEFSSISNEHIISKLGEFISKNNMYDVRSIGIALPGHYDLEVEHIVTNNLFWVRISLSMIRDAFSIPIHFENNVNCMAIKERLFGESKDDPNFLYLHFRRGIFCTYVYDGEIYARNNIFVGEVGHMVVDPNGEKCECGKHGCLQTYISQTWLINKAKVLYSSPQQSYIQTLVTSKDDITMDTILRAYRMGDLAIVQMLRIAINYLSIALNNLIVTLDTRIIYIHSQIFNEESLSEQLLEKIESNDSEFIKRKQIDKIIKPYSKQEGARGACALAIEQTLMKYTRKNQ